MPGISTICLCMIESSSKDFRHSSYSCCFAVNCQLQRELDQHVSRFHIPDSRSQITLCQSAFQLAFCNIGNKLWAQLKSIAHPGSPGNHIQRVCPQRPQQPQQRPLQRDVISVCVEGKSIKTVNVEESRVGRVEESGESRSRVECRV